jgi:hypothetical protein
MSWMVIALVCGRARPWRREIAQDAMITQVRDGVLAPGLKALEQRFGPSGPSMAAVEATPGTAGAR